MGQVDITLSLQDVECICPECGKKYNPHDIRVSACFHPISSYDADAIEDVVSYMATHLRCAECTCRMLNSFEWPAPYDGVTFRPIATGTLETRSDES